MKSNPKQKAVYLALCILAAIVVKRLQPVLGADLRPAARKA